MPGEESETEMALLAGFQDSGVAAAFSPLQLAGSDRQESQNRVCTVGNYLTVRHKSHDILPLFLVLPFGSAHVIESHDRLRWTVLKSAVLLLHYWIEKNV
jgi:hypothetical protein